MKYKRIISVLLAITMIIGALPVQAIGEVSSDYLTELKNRKLADTLNNYETGEWTASSPLTASRVEDKTYEELLAGASPYSNILEYLPDTRENVLFRENERFSDLKADDAAYLVSETGFPAETFKKLEQAGYSLADSAIYGKLERDYSLSIDAMVGSFSGKSDVLDLSIDADILSLYISEKSISGNVPQEMMDSLLSGYETDEIKSAGLIADILEMDVLPLLDRNAAERSGQSGNVLSQKELDSFEETGEEWGVNPDALIDHAIENGLSLEDIEEQVQERETTGQARLSGTVSLFSTDDSLDPYLKPPFDYNLSENDQYNPATGSFSHKEIDTVLPGRNGLDLVIGRVYNSYDDLNYVAGNALIPNYMKQWTYGLGSGWQFMFSSVENYYGVYLHTSDGTTYQYDSNSPSGLKDYELEDLSFVVSGSVSNPTGYTLYYKDGRREQFLPNGHLSEIRDRYGNTITFTYWIDNVPATHNFHANTDYTVTITDTLGQITTIQKASGVITVTLPDNGTLTYTTFYPADNGHSNQESHDKSHHYELESFEDQMGNVVTYEYQDSYCAYNYLNYSFSGAQYTMQYVLRAVNYPSVYSPSENESILYWNELTPVKIKTAAGFRERYYLALKTARANNVDLTDGNIQQFGIPDYTGYDYVVNNGNAAFDPNKPPSTYSYENRIRTRLENGATPNDGVFNYTYYSINHKGLVESEVTYAGMRSDDPDIGSEPAGAILYSVARAYYANRLPFAILHRDRSAGAIFDQIELYDYDVYGNVTNYRPATAADYTWDSERTIVSTYAYNSILRYSYLTSTTYKQDAATTIENRYIPFTGDIKSIQFAEVYVNNVLQQKTEYSYDTYGNIASEMRYTDPLWNSNYHQTTYSYTNGAFLEKVAVASVYDADGTLAASTPGEAAGTIATAMSYDTVGHMLSSTDGKGNTTSFQYNLRGDVTKITNPDSSFVTLNRDYANNKLSVTDELGYVTHHYYNIYGDEYKVEAGSTLLTERRYHFANELVEESNAYFVTTYAYDRWGRVLSKVTANTPASAPTLEIEAYSYNGATANHEFKTTKTVSNGTPGTEPVVTTTYVDTMGNVAGTGRMHEGSEVRDIHTYDYAGNRTQTVSAGGVTTKFAYNYAGQLIRTTNANNVSADNHYDALGNLAYSIDFVGNRTDYDYDIMGRLIKKYGLLDQSNAGFYFGQKYYYDAAGNLALERVKSNADGEADAWRGTVYAYDNRSRLTDVIDGGVTTSYRYDSIGNMETASIDGATTIYTYDRFGNVLTTTDPLNQVESRSYNGIGLPTGSTDRNGNVFVYTLDALGREYTVSATDAGGTITIQSRYAPNGELKSKTESGSGTTALVYTYDAAGRLTSSSYTGDELSAYTYYPDGQRKSYILMNSNATLQSASYTYNSLGLLNTVSEGNSLRVSYGYDANGRALTESLASGNVTTYTYNALGMPNTESHTNPNKNSWYVYCADGNLRNKTVDGVTTAYAYDMSGRLSSESESGGVTLSYNYDDRGNREQMTATGTESYTTDYIYNLNNRLTHESKVQGGVTEQTLYHYDPNGNQVSKIRSSLHGSGQNAGIEVVIGVDKGAINVYNVLGQLVEIYAGLDRIQYAYRPDGLRASKTADGDTTLHLWDMGNMAAEVTPGGTTAYLRGLGLVYAKSGSVGTYYSRNAHGDVYQLISGAGAVTKTYAYDAFGNEKNPSSNDANPFRYCAEYYDSETGSYYLRARYYSPGTGRFTQQDGYRYIDIKNPSTLNLYTYCGNNPILYRDPSGHDPVPTWAERINAGNANADDYEKAMSVNPEAWAGSARSSVDSAILVAVESSEINMIRYDLKNFDLYNTDEAKVLKSYYVSAYKGQIVIRTNENRSGSLGVMFLARMQQRDDYDIVRHEYGHFIQLQQLGLLRYIGGIFIPSAINGDVPNDIYYNQPWEVTADLFGGAQRQHAEGSETIGMWYYSFLQSLGHLWGP